MSRFIFSNFMKVEYLNLSKFLNLAKFCILIYGIYMYILPSPSLSSSACLVSFFLSCDLSACTRWNIAKYSTHFAYNVIMYCINLVAIYFVHI